MTEEKNNMSDGRQDDLELFADPAETGEILLEEYPAENTTVPQPAVREDLRENDDFSRDYLAAGNYLRKRREELGMSLESVQAETKMSVAHITALENGDFDHIPQPAHPVYIVAGVKKLGQIYGIDEATLAEILAGLKEQIFCQVPEDLSKSCYGHEVNEESLRKEKRLLLILAMLAGGLVLLIACGVILLVSYFNSRHTGDLETPFEKSMLLKIQPEPKLETTPLPAVEE